MIFPIIKDNFEKLQKKLTRLSNKCEKYGFPFEVKVLGEELRPLPDEPGAQAVFVLVEASGTVIFNDWEFIAEIEHRSPLNLVKQVAPMGLPEKYYTSTPVCEHCNSRRNRKSTYLLRNKETGEFKQVGKSCLKEFTRGLDAEVITARMTCIEELVGGGAVFSWTPRLYPVLDILQYAVEAVNIYGYQKSSDFGQTTRSVVYDMVFGSFGRKEHEKNGFDFTREGNKEKAEKVLAWIESLPIEYGYISNLKAATSDGFCSSKDWGIVVSAVAAYDREQRKLAEKKAKAEANARDSRSEWVGAEGEKVRFEVKEFSLITSWETEWGTTRLYRFTDEAGNVYTWKTSKWVESKPETLSGTIKKHTEFAGVKQTELTRCRV